MNRSYPLTYGVGNHQNLFRTNPHYATNINHKLPTSRDKCQDFACPTTQHQPTPRQIFASKRTSDSRPYRDRSTHTQLSRKYGTNITRRNRVGSPICGWLGTRDLHRDHSRWRPIRTILQGRQVRAHGRLDL